MKGEGTADEETNKVIERTFPQDFNKDKLARVLRTKNEMYSNMTLSEE